MLVRMNHSPAEAVSQISFRAPVDQEIQIIADCDLRITL